jgi:hypothetical protein
MVGPSRVHTAAPSSHVQSLSVNQINFVNHLQGRNQGELVDLVKYMLSLLIGTVNEGSELIWGRGIIVS